MTLRELVGTVMGIWLLTVIACLVSIRWAMFSVPRRFWPGVALSLLALLVGYFGMTHFRVMASRSVNGHVQWKFDSKWFFLATLVLAALALGFTIWRHRKLRPPVASPQKNL